jgi:opacity protein-like surface antigen
MKLLKFTLTCLFIVFMFNAIAQTEQGKWLIGGNARLNLSLTKTTIPNDQYFGESSENLNLNFSPKVGYFLHKKLLWGIEIPLTYETIENYGYFGGKLKTFSIAGAPFARIYVASGKVNPFLSLQIGVGKSKTKGALESTSDLFLYQLGGGLSAFLTQSIAIDLDLGYASIKSSPNDDNAVETKVSGLSTSIGIIVLL